MPHIIFQSKKIFYRAEGAGKVVLLLHGFAEDGNIWNRQFDLLKKDHFVIVPDLPGSGQSEMLEGTCTLSDYAEVVKAIVEEELGKNKKSTFSLIGHSMGGYITLAYAEKYPGMLDSFGLFHSSAFSDDEQKKETRRKAIEFIKSNGAEAFFKTATPNLFSEKTRNEKPELVEKLLSLAMNVSAGALIQYYEAMISRPDRTSVLKTFSKPVLFMIGAHDTAIPLQASLQQCYLPPVSSAYILNNSGHVGMWEEEQKANEYLSAFLKL
jgi:pimeloyl-ACP methyl ester carboxylesterase